jgi:hypothetical protein
MVFIFAGLHAIAGITECFSERGREREQRDSRRGCMPAPLPVFSCVLRCNVLIVNGIHFGRLACIFRLVLVLVLLGHTFGVR